MVLQVVAPGRYQLSGWFNDVGVPDVGSYDSFGLDVGIRLLQQSKTVSTHSQQLSADNIKMLAQLTTNSSGWFEAVFGNVDLKEVTSVQVSMQNVKSDWKRGLAWDGLRLRRVA